MRLLFLLVICPALSVPNGQVTYDRYSAGEGYPIGTIAFFSCDMGYLEYGFHASICNTSGIWNHPILTCKGNSKKSFSNNMIYYCS